MARVLLLLSCVLAVVGPGRAALADFTEFEDRPDLTPGGPENDPLSDPLPVPFDGIDFLSAFPEGMKLVRGSLDAGDVDAYEISLQAGDLLLAALFDATDGGTLDLGVGVFSAGTPPALALDDDGGRGFHPQLGHVVGSSGPLQLGVTGFGDGGFVGGHAEAAAAIAPYRLVLGATSNPAALQESDLDPGPQGSNDALATADPLPSGGGLVRASLLPGDVDHFSISLEEGDRLDVAVFDLSGPPGLGSAGGVFEDAVVGLFDPNDLPVSRDDDAGPGFGPNLSYIVPPASGGSFTLAVSGFDDALFAGAHAEAAFDYALLVSRDRACPDVTPLLSGVSASTPNVYEVAALGGGAYYYTDRPINPGDQTHLLVDVPEPLECAEWIKTANDDKNVTTFPHLTFTLAQDATVYIAYDTRATGEPAWLAASFTPLPLVIDVEDPDPVQEFDVLRRDFPAGVVQLGGNEAPGANSNYVVVAKPIDTQEPGRTFPIVPPIPTGIAAITLNGVAIEVPIDPGQTPEQVAQALADAVNASPTLAAQRVFALATGSTFVTTGQLQAAALVAGVPSASGVALAVLAALLAALALRRLARAA